MPLPFLQDNTIQCEAPLRTAMRQDWLADEDALLARIIDLADIGKQRAIAQNLAAKLVADIRDKQLGSGGVDALLNEFSLSTEEGVALMCLAEALLRVPDDLTADGLIRDKLQGADWESHLGQSNSMFVNASAWALMMTGKLVNYSDREQQALHSSLKRAAGKLGQPVIREAARQAMAIMGDVFVMGETIEKALERANAEQNQRYSFDMLGEAARTAEAAQCYFERYRHATDCIGRQSGQRGPIDSSGISIKLSALHPRYEHAQRERVMAELVPRLKQLARQAREYDIGLTVDAEETARLELSLDVIAAVFLDPDLAGWEGFGVAVQAYQKRAPQIIEYLDKLAAQTDRRLMLRLVKGAYWDTEIKLAQVRGLSDYPVFTRKANSDVCYQACAALLLDRTDNLYPQFATHNAWTLACVWEMAKAHNLEGAVNRFEFQRLHGMGDALYERVSAELGVHCRVYAPVGEHVDLLAYLVRRLLENGANSSFVNNIIDAHIPVTKLVEDPVPTVRSRLARQAGQCRHPAIPVPAEIVGKQRKVAAGFDFSDIAVLERLKPDLEQRWRKFPIGTGNVTVHDPANVRRVIGAWQSDDPASLATKLANAASQTANDWSLAARADFLLRLGNALQQHRNDLILLCIREAGKTVPDCLAEIREAIDFCRYYAQQALELGTDNSAPRGVVLCISPWNFPLAIFVGQICGAIAAGNTVLAKPAEQTSLIALATLEIIRSLGIPDHSIQLLLGNGPSIGEQIITDSRISCVMFTGSIATARWLFDRLASRDDAPVPLIAETGGQNAMIVDSSALPEQVVDDILRSGFQSAGQRCSSLRVLYLQEDIADKLISMISGAMAELSIGDPGLLASDIGPVIDVAARDRLQQHRELMAHAHWARLLHKTPLPPSLENGLFFAPHLYEIDRIDRLTHEVFGPVVHIIRYAADKLDAVIDAINNTGFGLTLGVHSRILRSANHIAARAKVGNVYINRDMIGAVVGVQPFGGHGLSGTGPKAGGPLYLPRLRRYQGQPNTAMAVESSRQLPGPTGESNEYRISARMLVHAWFVETNDMKISLQRLAVALQTGCHVRAVIPETWQPIADALKRNLAFKQIAEDDLRGEKISCLLVSDRTGAIPNQTQLLAGLDGPIPVVVDDPLSDVLWQRFVEEKVISINTAASGGNASLMTIAP